MYNLTSDFGLTLEEWTSINNQVFLTISVYYLNANNSAEYKVRKFILFQIACTKTNYDA